MYERGYRTGSNAPGNSGLTHLGEYMHCDFLDVDAPDNSFDAVFAIEALCHAPDKLSVYGEVFRLLKPGACFANYEYWLTDLFDTRIPTYREASCFPTGQLRRTRHGWWFGANWILVGKAFGRWLCQFACLLLVEFQ